jgi:NAD(P)-dependent dehydrogenase (short-subunit alcohol dehydrogenase family)
METHIDIKGLRVTVTGGTSGLGLALVRRLAAEGARIAFVARGHAAVERIANETGALGIVNEGAALVINISSDAAVNAYPGWGAYGASKAALRHLTAIWAEEAKADRVGFLSIDPGDMDTPLHALAVPDADPLTLKRPEHSASEIIDAVCFALSNRADHLVDVHA